MRLPVPLILASQSPRRRDLLSAAGFEFVVAVADDVIEVHDPGLTPPALTEYNARLKAAAVSVRHPDAVVLGADTLVYIDDEPLGKPATPDEAAAMLRRLSGRAHRVCTGVCLCGPGLGRSTVFHDLTTVTFRELDDATIREYLHRVHVLDKAGGYAVQEHGDLIIHSVDGSWSNVVGLPMEKTTVALGQWVDRPDGGPARVDPGADDSPPLRGSGPAAPAR